MKGANHRLLIPTVPLPFPPTEYVREMGIERVPATSRSKFHMPKRLLVFAAGLLPSLMALSVVASVAVAGAEKNTHPGPSDVLTTHEAVLVPKDGKFADDEVAALEAKQGISVDEAIVVFKGGPQEITVGVSTETTKHLNHMDDAVKGTLADMAKETRAHPTPDGKLEKATAVAQTSAAKSIHYDAVNVEMNANTPVPRSMYVAESESDLPEHPIVLAADKDCGKTWWPNYAIGHSGASEVSGSASALFDSLGQQSRA